MTDTKTPREAMRAADAALDEVTRADLYRGLAALARATGMDVG